MPMLGVLQCVAVGPGFGSGAVSGSEAVPAPVTAFGPVAVPAMALVTVRGRR